jgi:hypothetical protein
MAIASTSTSVRLIDVDLQEHITEAQVARSSWATTT